MAEIEALSGGVTLSLSALAQEFGFARETIKSRLDKGGVLPAGSRRGNPVFRLRDCIPALTYQSSGNIQDPKSLPPMERRAWFASEKDRLATEKEARLLIPVDDHRMSLAGVIQSTVQLLEMMPDVLERDCGLMPDQIERLEAMIDDMRNRWADQIECVEDEDCI